MQQGREGDADAFYTAWAAASHEKGQPAFGAMGVDPARILLVLPVLVGGLNA